MVPTIFFRSNHKKYIERSNIRTGIQGKQEKNIQDDKLSV